ncbi:hypothetical protein EAH85_10495 [Curtobacterium flaccumfaciens]|nr:hypothetical protein EAH85_10495 [Curtobacterium flaccumfaciens]
MFTPTTGRILDTAKGTGGFSTPMEAGTYRTIKVAGLAGVPDDGSVGAVSLNATVGSAPDNGTLFGRPDADTSRSTMLIYNDNSGEYVSNTATVAVGADGTIQIMTETSARVVLDVQGYYTSNADGTAAGGFVPVAGKRIVDTRSALGAPKATIAPGKSIDVQVTGTNDVPAGASGAVVNLIAINSTSSDGNLTPYATGSTKPLNSLHYTPSTTTSIQAQVGLSADGKMTIANSSSTVNLVIDLQGYFTAAGNTGASFTPGTGRAYDSRTTGNTALGKNETRAIQIAGTAGVPVMGSGITAVVLTLVVVHGGSDGRAAVWADGTTKPDTTAINFQADEIRTNTVTVPLGSSGKISLQNVADATNYVVDVQGWYTNPVAPMIACPSPYAAGSWTTTIPSSDIMCTVTAPPAADSESALGITVDGNSLDEIALDAGTKTNQPVAVPATGGEHTLLATVTLGDGSTASNAYVFSLGDWASGAFVSSPATGGTGYAEGVLAIAPANADAFGSDASFKFTVSTDPDVQAAPILATDWRANGYQIPKGSLTVGTTYYWAVDVTGTSGGSDTAVTVHSPTYSFVATDTIATADGQQVDAAAVSAAASPLSEEDATFEDNKNLLDSDVTARFAAIDANYSAGEALDANDLEFMRVYEFKAAPSIAPKLQSRKSLGFSRTKTSAGVTARFAGTIASHIGTISNSWSCSVKTTITKGKFKRIKSACQAQAWGAVAKKPYIGKIYDTNPSATGTKSPWSFSQNKAFTGYVTYVTVQPTTTVTTANGQFTMNADG